MKYLLMTIILGFKIQTTMAQISFKIEELILSNYNVELDRSVIDEDSESGPYIDLKCSILNNTNDSVLLKPAYSKIDIVFSYKRSDYTIDVVPLPFIDNETLIIPPKGTTNLTLGSYLLLGTKIFDYKRGNYIKEMLSILPTLKVVYQDESIKIRTDEIKNVTLK
jgi:hypothetical protein